MGSISHPPPADSPMADLPTISFEKLVSGDGSEKERLLDVCKTLGFFYLDLTDDGQTLIDDAQQVFKLMKEYFTQDVEVKKKDSIGSVQHGYTPTGTYAGPEAGKRDCYESLKVSKNEMMNAQPNVPPQVQENMPLVRRFMSESNSCTVKMLECLSDAMHLTGRSRFEESHQMSALSNTTLVLLSYPPQDNAEFGIGHNQHTDIGTLTLLFCDVYGLQLLQPETNEWRFIKPRQGHAVINVGDSLHFLSKNELKSCVHRVIPTTKWQEEYRFSIAYFLRPQDGTVFEDSKGREIKADDWHDQKYKVFRQGNSTQDQKILLGGMDEVLAVN